MWFWYSRGHTKRKIQGSGKSLKKDSKNLPKWSQNPSKRAPRTATKKHRKNVSENNGKTATGAPKMEPQIHPKAHQKPPFCRLRVRRHSLTPKSGPGGVPPLPDPQKTRTSSKNVPQKTLHPISREPKPKQTKCDNSP